MQRDHRPYFVKQVDKKISSWYSRRYLFPHFKSIGKHPFFIKPWYVEVAGSSVELGDYATVLASSDLRVRINSLSKKSLYNFLEVLQIPGKEMYKPESEEESFIRIGKYVLICPGVRMSAASGITIGEGCMFAQSAYITDSDWHDIYNRCVPVGGSKPIKIDNNVWIGDHAIVCKGVTIGENSIVGAGAVVTRDIPPNTIAAGNPAKVVKKIDPDREMITRKAVFANYKNTAALLNKMDYDLLKKNTIRDWMRYVLSPRVGD